MAYLNNLEREKLAKDLKDMNFNRAKNKVRGMDQKSRLAFYRNSQGIGRWTTRYDLPTLGTRVTLVEEHSDRKQDNKLKSEFAFVDAIVEPLPDNKS
jgi:hypothetical protein